VRTSDALNASVCRFKCIDVCIYT